jgi:hypothetical protein
MAMLTRFSMSRQGALALDAGVRYGYRRIPDQAQLAPAVSAGDRLQITAIHFIKYDFIHLSAQQLTGNPVVRHPSRLFRTGGGIAVLHRRNSCIRRDLRTAQPFRNFHCFLPARTAFSALQQIHLCDLGLRKGITNRHAGSVSIYIYLAPD